MDSWIVGGPLGTVVPAALEDFQPATSREARQGVLWVDIPVGDPSREQVLRDRFGFHPMAVADCLARNRVPKVHAYPDHLFLVLHAPHAGAAGHVHYIELDVFLGPGFLVTVHGPVNAAVDPAVALVDTRAVLDRLHAEHLHVRSAGQLLYAVLSTLTRRMEAFIEQLTAQVWSLEQRVTASALDNPQAFLEELFRARHGLLVVGTMGRLNGEVIDRVRVLPAATGDTRVPADALALLDDVIDQFERIRNLAEGLRDYLQGVIDFYRTRTDTKMQIAAERLAVVAVLTLPITALASVYGMNLIVFDRTQPIHLGVVLVVMLSVTAVLMAWTKRRGWW